MTAPHLHTRACSAVFACAVCPRPMFALFATPGGFLALCEGCARGYLRLVEAQSTPKEALT